MNRYALILSSVEDMLPLFKLLGFEQRSQGWMMGPLMDDERYPIHDWLEASETMGLLTWKDIKL